MDKEHSHRDRSTDLGVVRINNEAIMTIASIAALEVRGVNRMGGGLRKALYNILFNAPNSKGVKICLKENEVKLTVYIIVEYAVNIPKVADEVQENVKRAVERMTGLVLAEVDVVVEGVRTLSAQEKEKKI